MPTMAVNTSDFYFSDFTGDYYLTKDSEDVSHLRVVESATAVFPDYDQNKGICRQISFTNKNGQNVTLPNLSRDNLKLTRNGKSEPIYSIEKVDDYYDVCTGTEEYLHGAQTYVFEYEFEKVVTEFDGALELYWDTNGNGSLQRFDKVTARLHFEEKNAWDGDSSCYVGKYGTKGMERCETIETKDGLEFTAEGLKAKENLTFQVGLESGSFVVPEPDKNYAYVWFMVLLGTVIVVFIVVYLMRFMKTRGKANYYKGIFVKPEYQPHKKYNLPEMAEIYLGKKKDIKVAMLLDLVVSHHIELQRTSDDDDWNIMVKNLKGVEDEYLDLLAILNKGTRPEEGNVIEIRRQVATTKLVTLRKSMQDKIVAKLKKDGLVEAKYTFGNGGYKGIGNIIVTIIIGIPLTVVFGFMALAMLETITGTDNTYGQIMVFEEYFYQVSLVIIVIGVVICTILSDRTQKYVGHTKKGLEMARYMDGLKEYIELAEAERMKVLQSVKGADTSAKGIVKLYEKLLPYSAVFGLEDSWMKEMKKYCEVEEIEEPDYLLTGIATMELTRTMREVASYASTATVMSSSGGGSSSGFSGGGGGGFSGGGGGGGGFGGR